MQRQDSIGLSRTKAGTDLHSPTVVSSEDNTGTEMYNRRTHRTMSDTPAWFLCDIYCTCSHVHREMTADDVTGQCLWPLWFQWNVSFPEAQMEQFVFLLYTSEDHIHQTNLLQWNVLNVYRSYLFMWPDRTFYLSSLT